MYFWRLKGLKRQLEAGHLSDREVLPYVIAWGLAAGLAFAIPPEHPNHWDTAFGLLSAAATVAGTLWVYRQNGGASGVDFLQRTTSLSWVLLIRFLPATIVGAGVLLWADAAPLDAVPESTWRDVLFWLVLLVILYQRLGTHMRDVALAHPPTQPPQPARGGRGVAEPSAGSSLHH